RRRLLHETALEEAALDSLRQAPTSGSLLAMSRAESLLDQAATQPVGLDWRARVFELAEALFQSIRMQLSVERYQAISVGRGANLDTIDVPLNNRRWLEEQFQHIRKLDSESTRLKEIDAILNWTNPGPGGFYDELGNPSRRPHLVAGPTHAIIGGLPYAADPGFYQSPLTGFHYVPDWR